MLGTPRRPAPSRLSFSYLPFLCLASEGRFLSLELFAHPPPGRDASCGHRFIPHHENDERRQGLVNWAPSRVRARAPNHQDHLPLGQTSLQRPDWRGHTQDAAKGLSHAPAKPGASTVTRDGPYLCLSLRHGRLGQGPRLSARNYRCLPHPRRLALPTGTDNVRTNLRRPEEETGG